MGFIFTLILFAATLILSEVLKPKPNVENARPAGLGDFQAPTATEGRPIPLIWGTVRQKGPNVIWYGDLRQEAITEKVKTGLFSSKRVTTGFRYYLGIQMAISRGDSDWRLRQIWVGDKSIFTGDQGEGDISIDEPKLFGGDDNGSGGLVGTLAVRVGTETQISPSYLIGKQESPVTQSVYNYRGTANVTLEQGYIGNSTSIEAWSFEVTRNPDGLGLGAAATVNGWDANPANVIYEILTNDEWGLGLPPSKMNTAQMVAAGTTLSTEGNGFSFLWDTKRDLKDILREVERQIDGIVSTNPSTGQFEILLARGGYDIGTIPQVTEADLVGKDAVSNFTRGAWEDTQNFIQVQYQHRDREYGDTWAPAVDEGNIKVQLGNVVNANLTYPGVKDPALANNIAWRELRTLSAPLARVTLKLDRKFWDLRPNDVIAWTDSDLGITQQPFRVTRVNKGTLTDGGIVVDLVEDVFVFDSPAFSTPDGGDWEPPVDQLVDIPAGDRQIFEAPRAFCDRASEDAGVIDRVWVGVRNQGDGAVQAEIINNGVTDIGDLSEFLLAGELSATLNNTDPSSTTTITVTPTPDSKLLILNAFPDTITDSDIGDSLGNIIRIGDEFLGFTSITDNGLTITLNGVRRALMDTVQPGAAGHASGTSVWFLRGNITSSPGRLVSVSVEVLTESASDVLTLAEASPTSFSFTDRARRPQPAERLLVNGIAYPASSNIDTAITGLANNLDTRGFGLIFNRRDFRLANEVDKNRSGEPVLPADFPAANTTEYRAEVIDDPDGAATSLFFTEWQTGDVQDIDILRTAVLAATDGVIPSRLRLIVETRHTDPLAGVVSSRVFPSWDFDVTASAISGFQNLGALTTNEVSPIYPAPTTGTYGFNIGTNITSGEVQARINGGTWTTVIANGANAGTLPGVTAADDLEVRHTGSAFPDELHFLQIDAPSSSSDAYAILVL